MPKAHTQGPGDTDQNAINRCRAIVNENARLRCYESNLPAPSASTASPPLGKWRLVRTPNPSEGKEAISVMHSAEFDGSDPDFAGLMLRCAARGFDVLIILLAPLPPRAHPKVSVGGAIFDASVVPPGAALLLPAEASTLAVGKWQNLRRLNIEVSGEGPPIKGTVDLDRMDTALQTLSTACAAR